MGQKRRGKTKKYLSSQISRQVVTDPPPQLEVIQEPDTIDPDVDAYLQSFFQDFAALKPLEEISLLSPEEARAALKTLAQTQQQLQARMKTAQALKRMIKSKGV